jgi:hypothetical protein
MPLSKIFHVPVYSTILSDVTLFQCSLGRSHNTGLTVPLQWRLLVPVITTFLIIWFSPVLKCNLYNFVMKAVSYCWQSSDFQQVSIVSQSIKLIDMIYRNMKLLTGIIQSIKYTYIICIITIFINIGFDWIIDI